MKDQEFKKAKINGVEIPVIIDNRALVDYKREKGTSECKDLEDVIRMTWYGLKSGARRSQLEFKMSFEAFIDYTSDHPDYLPDDSTGSSTDGLTGSPADPVPEPVEGKKKDTK